MNVILFTVNYKKITANKLVLILFDCFLLSSSKAISYINVINVGIFIFTVCFLIFLELLERLKFKFIYLLLVFSIFIFSVNDFKTIKYKNYKLKTEKGTIYTYDNDGKVIKYAAKFIKNNTTPSDRVVIVPEGSIINYIINRKGSDLYYKLNPLIYYDVFERIK